MPQTVPPPLRPRSPLPNRELEETFSELQERARQLVDHLMRAGVRPPLARPEPAPAQPSPGRPRQRRASFPSRPRRALGSPVRRARPARTPSYRSLPAALATIRRPRLQSLPEVVLRSVAQGRQPDVPPPSPTPETRKRRSLSAPAVGRRRRT